MTDTHDPNLITESPTVFGGVTYTARRNARPESNGSWRWQVFAGSPTPALVGYIQSHACPFLNGAVQLLVFDSGNRPLCHLGKRDDGCLSTYTNALNHLRLSVDGVI